MRSTPPTSLPCAPLPPPSATLSLDGLVAPPTRLCSLFDPESGASLGVGLAGGVYLKQLDDDCPANSTDLGPTAQTCTIGLNDSAPCVLGFPCTSPHTGTSSSFGSAAPRTWTYAMLIEAVVGINRPMTHIDVPSSPYRVHCARPGQVTPLVMPPAGRARNLAHAAWRALLALT